jgi:hypothetical protein
MPDNSAVWNRNVLVALFDFDAYLASCPCRNLALLLRCCGLVNHSNIIRAIVYLSYLRIFFPSNGKSSQSNVDWEKAL